MKVAITKKIFSIEYHILILFPPKKTVASWTDEYMIFTYEYNFWSKLWFNNKNTYIPPFSS